jgi:Xaa-Pro aminopeptidase
MESSHPYFQAGFTAGDFRAWHRQIYEIIGSEAIAIVQGGPPVGGFEVFRQSNELFYLAGLEVPQAYLLLDGRKRAARLYLPRRGCNSLA